MDDVRAFFYKYYLPNNAIMVLAGDVTLERAKELAEKWFAPIPAGAPYLRQLPVEPPQTEQRRATYTANVPASTLYMAYHCSHRTSPDYHTTDLLSDILGSDKSEWLYEKLVKTKKTFNYAKAYVTGSIDSGLLVIEAKPNADVSLEEAEKQINEVISEFLAQPPSEKELTQVKNKMESSLAFSEIDLLNRAINLAFFALLGDASQINREADLLQAVTVADIQRVAKQVLRPENCSVMYYQANKS
jgi:predicted Zn-dependent peptidase